MFKKIFKITVFILFAVTIIWLTIFSLWFNDNIIKDLPDIEQSDLFKRSETNTITDRNWVVLFTTYDENRKYVEFEDISPHMINAIVSIEDKRYWEHIWVDFRSIVRAVVNNLEPENSIQGGSSIEQQFIKNTLLNNDQTFIRKLKEVVLVYQLNEKFKKEIREKNPEITDSETNKQLKKNYLELYLNYISFWNNSFWIETASETYFGTSASDLSILQSSILASLPKATSTYNPYRNYHATVWGIYWSGINNDFQKELIEFWDDNIFKDIDKENIISDFSTIIENSDFENKQADEIEQIINKELDILYLNQNWDSYKINYQLWRKDFVLSRMLEEWYITQDEFKQNFIDSLSFEIDKFIKKIRAPHFVMSIIEQINSSPELEPYLKKWWLNIKTTLDIGVQEDLYFWVSNNSDTLEEYKANNSAWILIDTTSWNILWYLGSKDFWNTDMQGQNDMILAKRQPWSTLKPFIYWLAFQNLGLNEKDIIKDERIIIWKNIPKNFDWNFMWNISLANALSLSRNIPAIKLYFSLWKEKIVKPFFQNLWMKSIKSDIDYWYPIALWSAEVSMLELAQAYSHLSSPEPKKINSILQITDTNWNTIYQQTPTNLDNIFENETKNKIFDILSSKSKMMTRQKYWMEKLGLDLAIKSWTSNINIWDKSFSRDWWLVAYNDKYVLILWAGNTNWSAMTNDAYGFFTNYKTMEYALTNSIDKWFIDIQ